MAEPFAAARGKLARAVAHLNLVARLIRRFVREECGARPEHDIPAGLTNVVVHLPTPPQTISLAIGDAVHNMRTALDYLVFEAIGRNPARPAGTPDGKAMFPICDTEAGYRAQVARGRLRGLPDEAQTIVQRVQPYHLRLADRDYTLHPLWVLNRLENIDKHRRLALTTGVGFESFVQIRNLAGRETTVLGRERLLDGDVVARYDTPGADHPGVEVDGTLLAFVALNEPGEFPTLVASDIVSQLRQIRRYLHERLLPAFTNSATQGTSAQAGRTTSDFLDTRAGADRTVRPASSVRESRRRKRP